MSGNGGFAVQKWRICHNGNLMERWELNALDVGACYSLIRLEMLVLLVRVSGQGQALALGQW